MSAAYELPYGEVDKAAKLIPAVPGMSIERAMKGARNSERWREGGGRIGELIEMARRVEGMPAMRRPMRPASSFPVDR